VLRRKGAPRTPHQEALAAVLDAGEGVALEDASAGWLWTVPGCDFTTPVQLTRQRGVSRPERELLGVVRERRYLPPHHVTTVAGIPTLTLPVLLYQLAARMSPMRFERVADTIVGRSPAVLRGMHDLMPELAARGRNGITIIRQYLEVRPIGTIPPTGLERKFERNFEDAGQRPPRRQVNLGGHEWIGRVDYFDDEYSLILEIQSETYHSSFLDKAADGVRAQELLDAGFAAVLQVPEEAVWYRPPDVREAVRLARLAVKSPDPDRFVIWIRGLGMQFQMTKRSGPGGGRMTA
jgi:hypothetical protein